MVAGMVEWSLVYSLGCMGYDMSFSQYPVSWGEERVKRSNHACEEISIRTWGEHLEIAISCREPSPHSESTVYAQCD